MRYHQLPKFKRQEVNYFLGRSAEEHSSATIGLLRAPLRYGPPASGPSPSHPAAGQPLNSIISPLSLLQGTQQRTECCNSLILSSYSIKNPRSGWNSNRKSNAINFIPLARACGRNKNIEYYHRSILHVVRDSGWGRTSRTACKFIIVPPACAGCLFLTSYPFFYCCYTRLRGLDAYVFISPLNLLQGTQRRIANNPVIL